MDFEAVVELANQASGNNFFAFAIIDSIIGDKSPDALKVVTEISSGLNAASKLS
jgi:hypothetical protein